MEYFMDGMKSLDREKLAGRMAEELPEIRKILGLGAESVAEKIGMDKAEYLEAEARKRDLKWSEYMSLLFLFWSNAGGRAIIEAKGLFPEALKEAMSVNRNGHTPPPRASQNED